MLTSPHDGLVMLTIIGLGIAMATVLFDQVGPWAATWEAWVGVNFEGDSTRIAFLNRLPTYLVIAEIMMVVGMAFPWTLRR